MRKKPASKQKKPVAIVAIVDPDRLDGGVVARLLRYFGRPIIVEEKVLPKIKKAREPRKRRY